MYISDKRKKWILLDVEVTYESTIFMLELEWGLPLAIDISHRDTCKAVVQIATIEIAIDYLLDIGPPESVLPREMIVVDLHEGFIALLLGSNIPFFFIVRNVR